MSFCFKTNHLVSSISAITLATGLVFGPLTTQKSLAQTAINGAGATSVEPLFTGSGGWFPTYGAPSPAVNSGVTFNYVGTGSGAGVTAFRTQVEPSGLPSPISFASSDSPAGPQSITGTPNSGISVQIPVVTFAVTLPYNSTGLTIPSRGLRLSTETYCGILNGNITNWNNSRITADNGQAVATGSGVPIRVVRRADSSGTTATLSAHLEAVCTSPYNWNRGVGNTVSWPSSFISATGGSGVISTIRANRGAIGYAENATRLAGTPALPAAVLQNRANAYITVSSSGVSTAFSGATDTDPALARIAVSVTNPSGSTAYPIVGTNYLLFYDVYSSNAVATGIRNFITWAFGSSGDSIATSKGYAPLPSSLKTSARNIVNTYVDTTTGR